MKLTEDQPFTRIALRRTHPTEVLGRSLHSLRTVWRHLDAWQASHPNSADN
jgi:hypothetical protein